MAGTTILQRPGDCFWAVSDTHRGSEFSLKNLSNQAFSCITVRRGRRYSLTIAGPATNNTRLFES